mgnify:CR=1 FL=1|jgi:hypothetical protein
MSKKEIECTPEETYRNAYKAYGLILRKTVDLVNRINLRKNLPEPEDTSSLEEELINVCKLAKDIMHTCETNIRHLRDKEEMETKDV